MPTFTPSWVNSERDADMTDAWLERMDPENERGEICTGHYMTDRDGELFLAGVSVEGSDGTVYRDRAWVVKMLGAKTVWRVEEAEQETARDEADPLDDGDESYDTWKEGQ